ncbi:dihydrodipicolinate synthase family protein [Paenibacillus sp. GCM10028914]|uniref:dihydrodipicolinate synthase family protein n=1 Tax=Paenibacillus sp. GCM10028914 TaxID=3273416 RepID=UPI003607E67C
MLIQRLKRGSDEQYLAGRVMGAEAGIGGTYGVMPELFHKIEQCYQAGDVPAAQHWQFIVNELITELLSTSSLYGACKEILRLRGFEVGIPRMPLPLLADEQFAQVKALNDKMLHYIQLSKD